MSIVGFKVSIGVILIGCDSCINEGHAAIAIIAKPRCVPYCNLVDSYFQISSWEENILSLDIRDYSGTIDDYFFEIIANKIQRKYLK